MTSEALSHRELLALGAPDLPSGWAYVLRGRQDHMYVAIADSGSRVLLAVRLDRTDSKATLAGACQQAASSALRRRSAGRPQPAIPPASWHMAVSETAARSIPADRKMTVVRHRPDREVVAVPPTKAPTVEHLPSPVAGRIVLTCAKCGGHAVERQSTQVRVAKAIVFGVFAAPSIAKNFRCTTCGHTW